MDGLGGRPEAVAWFNFCARAGRLLLRVVRGRVLRDGGFDRNIRVWHIPDRKATAWAHLNDAVTAVGCRASDGPGAPARLGVGTRGGQVFVYKSRDHTHVECDEMVLGTMRAGAFNEAERCGAAGIRAQSNALQGIVAGSAKPKKSLLVDSSPNCSNPGRRRLTCKQNLKRERRSS